MCRVLMFAFLFIPSLASATSLFQDPSREDLNALLNSYDKKDLACTPDCSTDGDRKNYIVSILALSDKKNNFGISKDCDKSVRNLKEMWREGINDAGYDLARMYYFGVCVDIDLMKTKKLLLATANNDYVPSQKLGRRF